MRHGFMRFMQAHGQIPGSNQRPRVVGALTGLLAGLLAMPVLHWSGALQSLSTVLHNPSWTIVLCLAVAAVAGVLYGALFRRAANDRRGGWLFGISYGFLLWTLGPIALLQAMLGRPLATGSAAMGILGGNLVFGLALGLLFPQLHVLMQQRLGTRGSDQRSLT